MSTYALLTFTDYEVWPSAQHSSLNFAHFGGASSIMSPTFLNLEIWRHRLPYMYEVTLKWHILIFS